MIFFYSGMNLPNSSKRSLTVYLRSTMSGLDLISSLYWSTMGRILACPLDISLYFVNIFLYFRMICLEFCL